MESHQHCHRTLRACCVCVFVECVKTEFWPLGHTGRGRTGRCRDLRLFSNGIDPVHLLLAARRLDEVMSVWLSDDLKQVALNVAFHTCGKPDGNPDISTNPVWVFHILLLKCDYADVQRLRRDRGERKWLTWGNSVILQWGHQTASQGEAASGADVILAGGKKQKGDQSQSVRVESNTWFTPDWRPQVKHEPEVKGYARRRRCRLTHLSRVKVVKERRFWTQHKEPHLPVFPPVSLFEHIYSSGQKFLIGKCF